MIISHNIAALNTFHLLNKVESAQSKSIEKLTSSLRINKAGDDAAGLAISEKMRGQIRGLSQANRNIQDGVSLVNIAEGGLKEIHSTLQRMRELSVQAATDTLTASDREQLQNEVNQLNKDINHIANTTEFNGISLLNVPKSGSYYHGDSQSNDDIEITDPVEPGNPQREIPKVFYWHEVTEEKIGFDITGQHQSVAWNGKNAVIVGSWDNIIMYDGEKWHNNIKIAGKDGENIKFTQVNVFKEVL